jgi:uncharacterized membrane protein
MTAKNRAADKGPADHPFRPFRTAVLRGLGVVLPPLLTIVILLWIWGTLDQYLLDPAKGWTRDIWVAAMGKDVRKPLQEGDLPSGEWGKPSVVVDGVKYELSLDGTYIPVGYRRLDTGRFVPDHVYQVVDGKLPEGERETADAVYRRYVELQYLRPYYVIPFFLSVFVLLLYLLGKFMAAGVGRFFYGSFERIITRVPFVRKVYSSVKQVSDFLLTDRQIEYSRVVAVEWPRKGIWTLALVTGPSFDDVRAAANEDVLSVLVPTSPMPMTGFTATVKRSETVDLDITVDEAIQFIVSCGVVVPPDQMGKLPASATTSAPAISASESSPPADS